jgi:hypothetical protein
LSIEFISYVLLLDYITVLVNVRFVGEESSGMRKSAVVSWYLEQLVAQGHIDSEDELLQRKTLVEKVIDRLMYHVRIILYRLTFSPPLTSIRQIFFYAIIFITIKYAYVCPGHNKRIAPLPFFHGCRKRLTNSTST